MAESRTEKLSKVASINPTLTRRPSDEEIVAFVPMSAVNAETGTISVTENRHFRTAAKGYTLFEDGDILFAKITPCFENGKIAHARLGTKVGGGSTEFHVIRPDANRVDSRYLLHFLRRKEIRSAGELKMTGSAGQRRVPESFVANLDVPVPTLTEQQRIAEVLDRADELRAKRREALAHLDSLTQSIFLDMFGDPIKNPHSWRRTPLGSLLSEIQSGHSPNCLDRQVSTEEWGVLKLSAITSCEYNPSENKTLPADVTPRTKDEVKPGDLLFSRKNTRELVGACALVHSTPPRLLLPDLIFRLVIKPGAEVNKTYLHRLLITPSKRAQIQSIAGGSASSMLNISKARLLTEEIELPPINLQNEFANRIDAIERIRSDHRSHLAELDALFASLQDRAFKGLL